MALFFDEKVSKDALEFIEMFLDNGLKYMEVEMMDSLSLYSPGRRIQRNWSWQRVNDWFVWFQTS